MRTTNTHHATRVITARQLLIFTGLSLCAVLLAGCLSRPTHTLNPVIKNKITATQIFVIDDQDGISAEFIPTTTLSDTMKGGLIWVLLDAASDAPDRATQQQAFQPIRQALNDYDLSNRYAQALDVGLGSTAWLNITGSKVADNLNSPAIRAALDKGPGSAVLICRTEYALTPSLRTLRINTVIGIYTRDESLRQYAADKTGDLDDAYLLYGNHFLHQHTLIGVENNQQQAAQAWLANNGEKLLQEIDKGMQKQAARISFDLEYLNTRRQ